MREEKVLLDATLGFLIKGDKILLAKKAKKIGAGCWNGYGGGINEGESPKEAMAREFNEEANIIVDESSLEKVAIIYFHNTKSDGNKFICKVYVYFVKKWQGDPIETEEMLCPTWFRFDSLPFDNMMPTDKVWMPEILSGKKIIAKAYLGPFQKESLANVEVEFVDKFIDDSDA